MTITREYLADISEDSTTMCSEAGCSEVSYVTDDSHSKSHSRLSSKTSMFQGPSYLAVGKVRFLIMDAPTDRNVGTYIKEMQARKVSNLVRACSASYSPRMVEKVGIKCHALEFPDGSFPPPNVINKWLEIVDTCFFSRDGKEDSTIAVHCIAGLGRAPTLVVLALIEKLGMETYDAIQLVRSVRKNALNMKQIDLLLDYKKHHVCCAIM